MEAVCEPNYCYRRQIYLIIFNFGVSKQITVYLVYADLLCDPDIYTKSAVIRDLSLYKWINLHYNFNVECNDNIFLWKQSVSQIIVLGCTFN